MGLILFRKLLSILISCPQPAARRLHDSPAGVSPARLRVSVRSLSRCLGHSLTAGESWPRAGQEEARPPTGGSFVCSSRASRVQISLSLHLPGALVLESLARRASLRDGDKRRPAALVQPCLLVAPELRAPTATKGPPAGACNWPSAGR